MSLDLIETLISIASGIIGIATGIFTLKQLFKSRHSEHQIPQSNPEKSPHVQSPRQSVALSLSSRPSPNKNVQLALSYISMPIGFGLYLLLLLTATVYYYPYWAKPNEVVEIGSYIATFKNKEVLGLFRVIHKNKPIVTSGGEMKIIYNLEPVAGNTSGMWSPRLVTKDFAQNSIKSLPALPFYRNPGFFHHVGTEDYRREQDSQPFLNKALRQGFFYFVQALIIIIAVGPYLYVSNKLILDEFEIPK
jgi:hypothetical protein